MPIRNVRRTRNIVSFVILPAGFFLLGYLGATVYWVFGLLSLPYGCLMAFLASRIRCPNCSTPVGWHKYNILGVRFEAWSLLTPQHCEHCGYDLTGRDGEAEG